MSANDSKERKKPADETAPADTGTSNGADSAASVFSKAQDAASDAYATSLEGSAAIYDSLREQASSALEAARDAAASASDKAAKQIADNPLAALIGGIALGAVAGVLIPRTKAEVEALSGLALGDRLSEAAKAAAVAARSTGKESLGDFVLNRETSMNDAVAKIIEAAFAAATSASGAALKSARGTEKA